jgi:hypothetical protein
VLLSVALFAKRHQVRPVQRDPWVIHVVSRKRLDVVNVHRRLDQAFAHADLTQATVLRQDCRPALPPGRRSVEALDRFIMMHARTLLAVIDVLPTAGKE